MRVKVAPQALELAVPLAEQALWLNPGSRLIEVEFAHPSHIGIRFAEYQVAEYGGNVMVVDAIAAGATLIRVPRSLCVTSDDARGDADVARVLGEEAHEAFGALLLLTLKLLATAVKGPFFQYLECIADETLLKPPACGGAAELISTPPSSCRSFCPARRAASIGSGAPSDSRSLEPPPAAASNREPPPNGAAEGAARAGAGSKL